MASSRITGTNENISTYGDGTRDYTSLATWEVATDNDLVTAQQSEVLECYADSASYDDSITIGNSTADSSYFRILRAAAGEGHDGTPGTGVIFAPTSGVSVVALTENRASVQDIVGILAGNSASTISAFSAPSASNQSIIGCIAKCTNAGAGGGVGFNGDVTGLKFVNCLAYECKTRGFFANNIASGSVLAYNCTAINSDQGYDVNAGTFVASNCLGSGNTGGDFAGTFTGTNNASSDATAPGTINYRSQTFTFVADASDNWHLHRNDLGAKFRGTDLSADATFPFDDDIDGDTITNWSIGFHAEETIQSSRRTGDNENVSTYAASGADYSSLSVWESATDNDLVTGAVTEVLECAAGAYDDTVSLAGATTDGRYFRIIRPQSNAHHGGLTGAGVRFVATTLTSNCVLQINENFSSVQDVYVETTTTSASTNFGVQLGGSADYATVVGCIAMIGNVGAGGGNGFGHATGSDRCRVANCLAIDCKTAGFAANGTSVNVVWVNNTSDGSPTGFVKGAGASVIAQNCLANNNATAGYSGTYATGTSHNASAAADAPGTSDRDSQTFKFVHETNNNFHLSVADAGAKGFGTSLDASPWFNMNDDIDRVDITTWSIGFDSDPNHAGGKAGEIRLTSKVHGVLT